MAITVQIDEQNHRIPQNGDSNWGEDTTKLLQRLVHALRERMRISAEETITGAKTFTRPIVLSYEPNAPHHAARKQDVDNIKDQTKSFSAPIGSIIALYPSAPTPDVTYWWPCDGTERHLPSDNFNGRLRKIPNLTDDIFLMGSIHNFDHARSSRLEDINGGSNQQTLTIDNLPQHTHDKGTLYMDSAGRHTHSYVIREPGNVRSHFARGGYDGPNPASGSILHGGDHTHRIQGSTGNIAGQTGTVSSIDNRPKYFKVMYYMRVR